MTVVYLGLGSNVEPGRHLRAGLKALREAFGEVATSPVYRSPAVGFEGEDFLNLAARIETDWAPERLKTWLAALEDSHGRRRGVPKFSDRTLDIDILLYGNQTKLDAGLEIPRREILKYAHVLRPLTDLAPDVVHPLTGQRIGQHWQAFGGEDTLIEQDLDL